MEYICWQMLHFYLISVRFSRIMLSILPAAQYFDPCAENHVGKHLNINESIFLDKGLNA